MSQTTQVLPTKVVQSRPTAARSRPSRPAGYGAGLAGAVILLVLGLIALFPDQVAPYDPHKMVALPLRPPSLEHLLGTNDIGQDLFSELLVGTRVSLFVGLVVASGAVSFGALVGILSATGTGLLGTVLVRLTDLCLVLPFLPLVILISAYLGPSQRNVILVLALFLWATPARMFHSRVLALSGEQFVEASRALGASSVEIMVRHIWPGVRLLFIVQFILVASASILAEASLSFLGLGDPSVKSWGAMLYFARASGAFLSNAWKWWVLPTGAMITLTVLSLVLIGYSLEYRAEPHLRLRR